MQGSLDSSARAICKLLRSTTVHSRLQEELPKAEGLISYQKAGSDLPEDRQQLFVAFSEADLKSRGLRFSRGDMVEFILGSDPTNGRQTASQVQHSSQKHLQHLLGTVAASDCLKNLRAPKPDQCRQMPTLYRQYNAVYRLSHDPTWR